MIQLFYLVFFFNFFCHAFLNFVFVYYKIRYGYTMLCTFTVNLPMELGSHYLIYLMDIFGLNVLLHELQQRKTFSFSSPFFAVAYFCLLSLDGALQG